MEAVELALKILEPWKFLVLDGLLEGLDLLRVDLELLFLDRKLERVKLE